MSVFPEAITSLYRGGKEIKISFSGPNGLADMLLIAIVMLYSLSAHCASSADAQGDLRDVVDGNVNFVDYDELGRLHEASDQRVTSVQKRTCRLGIHSHNCALLDLLQLKNAENYLKSADSPGKRSVEQNEGVLPYLLIPDRLSAAIVKRDCRFRLGGHCLTEALDRAANQYYYLKSADSPGRRRRETVLFNRRLARL